MNTKAKALWGAFVVGFASFLAWLANTPPSQQDTILAPLIDIIPINARPIFGLVMKALSVIAVIYVASQHQSSLQSLQTQISDNKSPIVLPPSVPASTESKS